MSRHINLQSGLGSVAKAAAVLGLTASVATAETSSGFKSSPVVDAKSRDKVVDTGSNSSPSVAQDSSERFEPSIDLIETFGLRRLSRNQVMGASRLHIGDHINRSRIETARRRIEELPGVREATVSAIYGRILTDGEAGLVLYIGIEEDQAPQEPVAPLPTGSTMLPEEILNAHAIEQLAFAHACRDGVFAEDRSHGHSLSAYPELRAAQERYCEIAASNWCTLVNVLHSSADSQHRAIAAKVLSYAANKKRIMQHLVRSLDDEDAAVRNSSMRSLSLILRYARLNPGIGISPSPAMVKTIIMKLSSSTWTDRNKAIALLLELDDSSLTRVPRTDLVIADLIEMSRWETIHGQMAFQLLSRIMGVPEGESHRLCKQGKHEKRAFIAEVCGRANTPRDTAHLTR